MPPRNGFGSGAGAGARGRKGTLPSPSRPWQAVTVPERAGLGRATRDSRLRVTQGADHPRESTDQSHLPSFVDEEAENVASEGPRKGRFSPQRRAAEFFPTMVWSNHGHVFVTSQEVGRKGEVPGVFLTL